MNAHIHPVMQAALAPFAPRHRQPRMELDYDGVPLVIEYDYYPAEAPVYDVESPVCGPGCSAEVDICGVYVGGHDILDLLRDGTLKHIAELVLEKLESR